MKKKKIEIIYEDEYLLAVNKPADLLTIPDRFRKDIPNLFDILIADRDHLYTVHRLDKYTSGGILFAKDKETHALLNKMFMDRVPEKYYVAIVDGIFRDKEGEVNEPLSESTTTRGKMLVHPRGKESRTAYQVIEEFVVDHLYGKREEFFLSEIKRKKFNLKKGEDERPLISRQPLHSRRLRLPHPHTNEPMDLEFPIPKDINAVLKQFRKILKKSHVTL